MLPKSGLGVRINRGEGARAVLFKYDKGIPPCGSTLNFQIIEISKNVDML